MLVSGRTDPLQEGLEDETVALDDFHVGRVVIFEVSIRDADEAPEGLDGGHVHQEERRDRGLRLTVSDRRVLDRVRFQDVKEFLLAVN